jgi:hypothetical protein
MGAKEGSALWWDPGQSPDLLSASGALTAARVNRAE